MTPYMHYRQQPVRTSDAGMSWEAPAHNESDTQAGLSASPQVEQSALSVMHPDHHDPDWRYYFGAMAG